MKDGFDAVAIESAAKQVQRRGISRYTRFLDPAQSMKAEEIAQRVGVSYTGWGGYVDAERCLGCFYSQPDEPQTTDFPLVCLYAAYDVRYGTLSHRDILGAFMALGLTRDCLGDIIIGDGMVFLFAEEKLAPYIMESFTEAGHTRLQFSITDAVSTLLPKPKGSYFRSVVSSLRLDAVLASAYHVSRTKAAEFIRAGGVKINHLPCERTDTILSENTMLSVRGLGRVRFVSMDAETKKERLCVTFFKYE